MTFRHPRSGTEGSLREVLEAHKPQASSWTQEPFEIQLTREELLAIVTKIDGLAIAFRGRSLGAGDSSGAATTKRR